MKYIGIIVGLVSWVFAQEEVPAEKIQELQNYLNGLSTFKANLIQRAQDNKIFQGRIFMSRLGKYDYGRLRLEYDPPARDLVVVDGRELIHKDLANNEVNRYGVDSTPAAFLLKKRIDFKGDLRVKSAKKEGTLIHLALVNPGDDEGMSLTLTFETKPFIVLKEWSVFDGQGNTTDVKLSNVEIGTELNDKLFKADE